MIGDLYPNPYQSAQASCYFNDFFGGAGQSIFDDPYASARQFYGEAAMQSILQSLLEAQRQQNEQQRIRAERLPEMVDDVAAQWHSSWGDWP